MEPETQRERNLPQYNVVNVEKSEPAPEWLPEGNWCRYTIERGNDLMDGYKKGTVQSVTKYAEGVAKDLTERARTGKSGYAVSKGNQKKK